MRAPHIRLCGRMPESAFTEPQWLVLVNDRAYLQLSELLYRVVEQANGRRGAGRIAARVGTLIGRRVRPEIVTMLVARTLIPMGLLRWADEEPVPVPPSAPAENSGAAGVQRGSPLAVTKLATIDHRHVAPFTAVLQGLYWPPIVVAVLGASAAAISWLIFGHDLGRSLGAAVATPGRLLLVMLLTIVGGAFHELGHAAALRYAGGAVRGMGVGIYLVYPAFYTDVSDNYRLGRWARVRTDLGGFYFNLVFVLALLTAYAVTGAPALLLVVVLTLLDIVRQSLPFVRLDGYWALADLTGIPDFFSQMGAFLRSVLPLPWWKGMKLPPLKRWVKAVFVLYITVTVPLLLGLLLTILQHLPRMLTTAAAGLARLAGIVAQAAGRGDLVVAAAALMQLVMVALPAGGVLLMLWSIGRQMVMTLWRLSAPTPRRRAAGALAGAGLIALAPLLWTLTPPTPAQLLAQALSPPATALTSAWAGARRLVDTASDRRAIPDAGRTAADAAAAGRPADDPRRSPVVLPHPGATPLQVWDFAGPREPDTGPDGGENPEAGTSAGAAATRGARLELFGDGHYCIADAAAVRRCGRYRLEAGEMGGPAQPGATVLEVGDDGADATLRDGAGAVVAVRRAASPPLEPNR